MVPRCSHRAPKKTTRRFAVDHIPADGGVYGGRGGRRPCAIVGWRGGGLVQNKVGGGRVYVATHRRSAGMSEERDQKNLLNATSLECWASVLQERLKALTHRSNPKNLSGS